MHCALIARLGFPSASLLVGITMAAILSPLTIRVLRHSPDEFGLHPDGASQPTPGESTP
jgi:hypothetical protein